MPTDDYYALIGVSPDADRDTIREAYRARRAELTDDESGRTRAAQLNRAWNVLSDTTQRERYDAQLAAAREDDDVVVPEIVSGNGSSSGRPLTRGEQRRERYRAQADARANARSAMTQVTEVNGVPLASNRDRIQALVVDAFICFLLLVVGAGIVATKLADSQKPEVKRAIDKLTKDQDTTQKQINALSSQKGKVADKNSAQYKTLAEQQKAAETHWDDDQKKIDSQSKKLNGINFAALAGAGVLTFLIFTIPTALTGQSPGKKLRKIKLVKDDGVTPVGWKTAAIHYGAVIGFVVVTGAFGAIAQIAWIVAIWGVSSFARSPRRQGWDNRISKTVVVQA